MTNKKAFRIKITANDRRLMPSGYVETIAKQKSISTRQVNNILNGKCQDNHQVIDMAIELRNKNIKYLNDLMKKLKI